MGSPLDPTFINILIRTSKRPQGFKRVIDEIQRQAQNVPVCIIVSVDNQESLEYVLKYSCIDHVVQCTPQPRQHKDHNPYNEYYNELITKTKPGWVWRIDDDDIVMPGALETIQQHVENPDVCYIFNILSHVNTIFPSDTSKITYCDIATPNFVIHTKHNDTCRWKPVRGGDYRFLQDLLHSTPSLTVEYIDKIIYKVDTQSFGDRDEVVTRSCYFNELLCTAYRDRRTWILEMGAAKQQREWCKVIGTILKDCNQRVVNVDTQKLSNDEFLSLLLSISADYYVASNDSSLLFSATQQGKRVFEIIRARILFVHQPENTLPNPALICATQDAPAFQRISDRAYHLCCGDSILQKLQALNVGSVYCVGSDGNQTDSLFSLSHPEIESFWKVHLYSMIESCCMPVDGWDSRSLLRQVFSLGSGQDIDRMAELFTNRNPEVDSFLFIAGLYKEKGNAVKTQHYLFEALKHRPESRNILMELAEVSQQVPDTTIHFEIISELQQKLQEVRHG